MVTDTTRQAPLLVIGAQTQAIKEARATIMDILRNPTSDESTKVAALETLRTLCAVTGTTITNSTFTGG